MLTATAPEIATPVLDGWLLLLDAPPPGAAPASCVSCLTWPLAASSVEPRSAPGSGAGFATPGAACPWLPGNFVFMMSVPLPLPAPPPPAPAPVPLPAPAVGLDTREPATAKLPTKPLFSARTDSDDAVNAPAGKPVGAPSDTRKVSPIKACVQRLTSLMDTLMPTPTACELAAAPAIVPTQVASVAAIAAAPDASTVAPRPTCAKVVALVELTSTTPLTASVLAWPPDAPSVTETNSLSALTVSLPVLITAVSLTTARVSCLAAFTYTDTPIAEPSFELLP